MIREDIIAGGTTDAQKAAGQAIFNGFRDPDNLPDHAVDDVRQAVLAQLLREQATSATAAPPTAPARLAAPAGASPFTRATAVTGRSAENRLSHTVLYDRATRKDFPYEDVSRLRAQAVKGIPNGYVDTDLDALARTDKPEDRSKALKSITHVVQTNRRFCESLVPYGMDECFTIRILDPSNATVVREEYDLFTEWHKVTVDQILQSCNNYTLYIADDKVLKTYEQDMIWSRTKLEASISSNTVLQKVHLSLELHEPYQRIGPLTFKLLMDALVQCSEQTRAVLKQTWLYHLKPTDYDGGNITEFATDWRGIRIYLESMGEDVSDSVRQLFQALITCPNVIFANHFRTLYTMQDAKLDTEEGIITEANTQYRRLVAEGKWSVHSTKEHAAFRQKKKEEAKKKAQKLAAKKAAAEGTPTDPKANQGQVSRKTHDAQGHAIDRTPPKDSEPKKRENPQTKLIEEWCGNKHCFRWGNHSTENHDAWYKKLLENKKKRQQDNKDKALESQSSSGAPQIPTRPLNGQSREQE